MADKNVLMLFGLTENTLYIFTEEQLFEFLETYCGCTFDATGKEKLIDLLDTLPVTQKLPKGE